MTNKKLAPENTELLKDWMEMTDRVEKLETAQIKQTGIIDFLYTKLEETHKEITRHKLDKRDNNCPDKLEPERRPEWVIETR
jgi:hypothetical protein